MDRELLFSITRKDLKINFFSGTGGGGQHRNKHQNCVRIYHEESGVRTTGQSNKERKMNMREALKSLAAAPAFNAWLMDKIAGLDIEGIKREVEKSMQSENLKTEYWIHGEWHCMKGDK